MPWLVSLYVPQADIPLWLGKASLCVLECVVAAAGSALRASIAAQAAMTESRRSMETVYLRVVFGGTAKSSSISEAETTRRTVTGRPSPVTGPGHVADRRRARIVCLPWPGAA